MVRIIHSRRSVRVGNCIAATLARREPSATITDDSGVLSKTLRLHEARYGQAIVQDPRGEASVPFTTAIVATVLAYTWFVEGKVSRDFVLVPSMLIVALTVWHDRLHGEWGFSWRALGPGLWRALAITLALGLVFLGAGAALGTLHDRRDFLGSLAPLVVWGGAQQWVLQTAVLREAQRATSKSWGIPVAALLFGAVHLPNPFLTAVTTVGALVWCWLYDRYPNIIPLALSHALGTLAILYAFDGAITGRLRIGASYLRLDL
jgi:membrane protease YdiL (CAAX protease family)